MADSSPADSERRANDDAALRSLEEGDGSPATPSAIAPDTPSDQVAHLENGQ